MHWDYQNENEALQEAEKLVNILNSQNDENKN
jgi:hypothetical protein